GAFLLDDALDVDGGGGLEAGGADGVDGEDAGGQTRLHVAGAAAVHAPPLDARLEGRGGPARGVAGRDDVDMAVDDQRAALLRLRAMGGDDVEGLRVVDVDHRREAGQIPDVVDLDPPVVDLEAALAEGAGHEVLHRGFVAPGRIVAHHVGGEGELRLEAGVDGGEDALAG